MRRIALIQAGSEVHQRSWEKDLGVQFKRITCRIRTVEIQSANIRPFATGMGFELGVCRSDKTICPLDDKYTYYWETCDGRASDILVIAGPYEPQRLVEIVRSLVEAGIGLNDSYDLSISLFA